jgi:ankyrin repeat protein
MFTILKKSLFVVVGVVIVVVMMSFFVMIRIHHTQPDMSNKVDRLRWAAQAGREDVVLECIAEGVDIDDDQSHKRGGGATALAMAARVGNISIMRVLLIHGADVEAGRLSPLRAAVQGRSQEAISLLLSAGADINKPGWASPTEGPAVLWQLVRVGDVELLEYCQGRGLRVLPSEAPALMLQAHDVAMIERLVELGFDVNARSRRGWTPLHFAAFMGELDRARALVEGGATVDIEDYEGASPLDIARSEGHVEVVEYLESLEQ